MKAKLYLATLAIFTCQLLLAQPCVDGLSDIFPCDLIDQESMLPLIDFQTENLNDIWGWTSPETGREYVIQGAHNKTAFIDISSPAHPIYLGYLPTATNGSLWRDIKVIDNYAYIVAEAEMHGMQIFDLTRLESLAENEIPVVFDEDAIYNGFGNCHNIVADTANKFVYAVGTGTFSGGPHIIDVQNPLTPTYAGSNSQAGYTHDAQVFTYTGPDDDHFGKEILVGFNESIVAVYDVTDKTDVNVISITGYENVGYVHQGWFTEDQRYMISNDETDELDFGINTRSIIWDMQDLDNPEVVEYVDLGTESVDHNLYIKGDMVYQSNYTTGLRILDILEIGEGHLEPFGFYDVFPMANFAAFFGSWSNYPYFESGVIAVSNMYGSFHALRPRFYAFDSPVLKVCSEDQASLEFSINKRMLGEVTYSVEMADEGLAGLNPDLLLEMTTGAPAQNTISFSGLNALEPGYYSGEMVVNYSLGEERIPFVLIKDDGETLEAPALIAPSDQTLPDQLVLFSFTDPNPGYATLQVALDENFEDIVYESVVYNSGQEIEAEMPFDQTTYYWRLLRPSACSSVELVSETATFNIDVVTNTTEAEASREFSLYPNPATDHITILHRSATSRFYEIFDISGRLVKRVHTEQSSGVLQIDVSTLTPGAYVLKQDGKFRGEQFVKH